MCDQGGCSNLKLIFPSNRSVDRVGAYLTRSDIGVVKSFIFLKL